MTTALYFLSLVWASRLFPGLMNQITYPRINSIASRYRSYRWAE